MVEYDEVTPLMLRVIPELGPAYLKFVDERAVEPGWAPENPREGRHGRPSPGPEQVLREMLVPFVRSLLGGRPSNANRTLISRIFSFLEQLSVGTNPDVQCLVEVSFCDALVDDAGTHRKAMPLMGPNTREFVEASAAARRAGPADLSGPDTRPGPTVDR